MEGREKPLVELMGYLGEREIYKAIDRGEELNLGHCYIEKFSLRDYRLTRNLEEKEVVILKRFTARNSLFGGDANLDFSNAVFEGTEFSLEGSWVNRGDVIFESAHFKTEHLTFHNTHFPEGYFNFKNVHIDAAEVSFKNCCFGDGTKDFQYAKFGTGHLSFMNADFFDGDVSFERTSFGFEKVSFYKSWFHTLSLRFCHLDGFIDLRVQQCLNIDLSNTIVRDIIDLNPHEFNSVVQTLYMGGMRLIDRFYIDWKRNQVKSLINSQTQSSHRLRAEQFRILKENFKNLGLYNSEDYAYVEFKRNESRANLTESVAQNRLRGLYQYPLYWFKLVLFDNAGLYATSPVRVLITMVNSFIVFSLLYLLLLWKTSADIVASVDDHLSMVARSFYHSAITFLTIGYGDYYPFGMVRWVSALEGFVGLFLMSYFTVAFVRKILR